MTTSWRVRATIATVLWLAMVIALVAMQMRPSVPLLAGVTLAIVSSLWMLLDLADVAAPVSWVASRDAGGTGRGADPRVRLLHRQLTESLASDGGGALRRDLVALIDDRLHTVHGIDRATEPGRAGEQLEPALRMLVTDSSSSAGLTDPRQLAAILAAIEVL